MRRAVLGVVTVLLAIGCTRPAPTTETASRPPITRPDRPLTAVEQLHYDLYDELKPVRLSNCEFERIGDSNDGGYVMCANLVTRAEAFYSYGIAATDNWGCTLSARQHRPVHQYDCFELQRPPCDGAAPVFHEECVGGASYTEAGRIFDTVEHQIQKNGDTRKRLVMKMDVEGSEWASFESMSDSVLEQIDQLSVEFHGIDDPRALAVIRKLKRTFHLVNVHFNNYSCSPEAHPLPATVFEVLLVSKSLGSVDPAGTAVTPNPLDAPNAIARPDCQSPS